MSTDLEERVRSTRVSFWTRTVVVVPVVRIGIPVWFFAFSALLMIMAVVLGSVLLGLFDAAPASQTATVPVAPAAPRIRVQVPQPTAVAQLVPEDEESVVPPPPPPSSVERQGQVLTMFGGIQVRIWREERLEMERRFPELKDPGFVAYDPQGLEEATSRLFSLFGGDVATELNSPSKVAVEAVANDMRQHMGVDQATVMYSDGLYNAAETKVFTAIGIMGSPDTVPSIDQLELARSLLLTSTHELEAAVIFLNPRQSAYEEAQLDQDRAVRAQDLLTDAYNLYAYSGQRIDAAIKAEEDAKAAAAAKAQADASATAEAASVPTTAAAPSQQSQAQPAGLTRSAFLNTPAQAMQNYLRNANSPNHAPLQPQSDSPEALTEDASICLAPIMLNNVISIGAMPSYWVNWAALAWSNVGGPKYVHPKFTILKINTWDSGSIDANTYGYNLGSGFYQTGKLHLDTPDIPVVEFLMQKTTGSGPDVVSFYTTDAELAKLREVYPDFGVGSLVTFQHWVTGLGLQGP